MPILIFLLMVLEGDGAGMFDGLFARSKMKNQTFIRVLEQISVYMGYWLVV
jgi:hypothetical protein